MATIEARINTLKAFHNEETDYIPVGFWHHYLKRGQDFNNGINNPEIIRENLEGAKKFKDEYDPDFVKIMTDGYFNVPVNADGIKKAADLDKLAIPEDKFAKYLNDTVELVKGYREIYGENTLLFLNVFAPFGTLFGAVREDFFDRTPYAEQFLAEDSEAVEKALDKIADAVISVIRAAVKPGLADGIYLSVADRNHEVSEELYTAHISPSEKRIIAEANKLSPDNILHICGYAGATNPLSVFRDYDIEVINFAASVEGISLSEGKEFFHGKAVIGGFGNTEKDILFAGTKEQIEAETNKILAQAGRKGVIIGADCTVPSNIDPERLKWVREIANRR